MSERLLVCTDLDRTLIPNGPQSESPGARQRFAALCARPEVSLAFVTGRHRALIEQAIAYYCLPLPDFAIADVGTTIYRVGPRQSWQREDAWDAEIEADWNGLGHADLKSLLGDVPSLRLQETVKQNRLKLSYYVPMHSDRATLSAQIEQRLRDNRVAARLIWSDDEPAGVGLLDVIPRRASKYHAIKALMRALDVGEAQTVFAGDSGNDLEVLSSEIPAVIVANSQEKVRKRAAAQALNGGNRDRLYFAKGGFMGMNGNYAAGILEGLAHYHPDTAAWMEPGSGVAE
jgi:HAD superfamily hydrolase (TIGR01484 family)